jgi:hypothetical protein
LASLASRRASASVLNPRRNIRRQRPSGPDERSMTNVDVCRVESNLTASGPPAHRSQLKEPP